MTETIDCEVLVVGSGPGGAVTAAALSRAGRDVVLVEEGPDSRNHALRPYSSEEMDVRYRNGALTPCLGKSRVTYAEGRCLGGGSEVNSGFFHRLPDEILEQWRSSHGLEDLTAEALEPHYRSVEQRLSVAPLDGGEGKSSQKLKAGADALGWHSQEVPRWITSVRDGAGAWSSRRHGMATTYIADAVAAGCRVMTDLKVERLSFAGRRAVAAQAVRLNDYQPVGSAAFRFSSIFLCAGAIGTPALLQRSGHRRNIGVGLRMHPMARAVALFDDEVNESEFGVPVRQVVEFKPELTLGCSVSALPHLALWLATLDRDYVVERATNLAIFYALITSDTRGRVRNLPFLPEPLVTYDLTREDRHRLIDGLARLAQLLFAAGAREVHLPFAGTPPLHEHDDLEAWFEAAGDASPEATAIHLFATAPLGADARRAPLDPFGRLRASDNVWVNDVSMLPGCTGVNPQGTVMAIALRNTDRFLSASPTSR